MNENNQLNEMNNEQNIQPSTVQPTVYNSMTTPTTDSNYNPVPPTVETGGGTPDDSSEGKQSNGKVWIFLLIVLVLLIGGAVEAYFLIFANPKQAFQKTIDTSFNMLTGTVKKLDNQYSSFTGGMNVDYDITSDDTDLKNIMDIINNVDLRFKYGFDYKNKVLAFNLDTQYKKETLVNADIYGKDGKMYILLKDIMKRYVSVDIEEYDKFFNREDIHTEDYVIILNSIKAAFKKAFENETIKKENTTITVNGKEEKVTRNYLVINSENAERIVKNFIKSLQSDKVFMETAAKLSEVNEKELSSDLEQYLNSITVNKEDKSTVSLSIYTSGLFHSFVAFGMDLKYEEETLYSIMITSKDSIYEFSVSDESGKVLSGTLKDNSQYSSTSATIKEELSVAVPSVGTVKVKIDRNIKYNDKVTEPDISNSIDYEKLTEEEANEIATKLLENKAIEKFMTDIQNIYQEYSDSAISFRSR